MNLLGRLGFKRRVPLRLKRALTDPLHGDSDAARALGRGDITLGRESFALRSGDWDLPRASYAFRSHVHGFVWLRDLAAALPPEKAATFAAPVIAGWLSRHEEPDEEAWRPDRSGLRIAFWLLYAPLVLSGGAEQRKAVLKHILAAAATIDRRWNKTPKGLPRLQAASGFTLAALLVEGSGLPLKRAEKLLEDAANETVLPHGLPASRTPADLLAVLEWAQICRLAYVDDEERDVPEALEALDGRARAGLKAARLGDGRLTAIHGGNLAPRSRIEHVLGWPGLATRGVGAGAASGLQRLESGRTIICMDAGPPPDPADNAGAHAGALAFEMSDEHERLIVNVGGGAGIRKGIDPRLKDLVRFTAAHSTLVLGDTNQSVVEPGKPLGDGVEEVEVERDEKGGAQRIAATHDGYVRAFGLRHMRSLALSEGGRELAGADTLEPAGRKKRRGPVDLAIRFHLTPQVDVTPTADQRGAVLRLPSGALWQFKAEAGMVSVDESLWIGEEGRAHRTRQLVVSDETGADGWSGTWTFRKMG